VAALRDAPGRRRRAQHRQQPSADRQLARPAHRKVAQVALGALRPAAEPMATRGRPEQRLRVQREQQRATLAI
jgi:hypothetical protein